MENTGKKPDENSLLKEAYRYLSEYVVVLEFHDKYSILDKDKIDKIRELKDKINKIV